MAEMDDVLAELRHRIMGQLKPARPQHQQTNGEGPAMTQPVNIEQRRGSAAVALRRLAHPERDGSAVVEEPVSEPINPERDDPISPLLRRLSLDMPELMEEVVAFIRPRRWPAECTFQPVGGELRTGAGRCQERIAARLTNG
jgi:hypothetical protein